MRRKEGEKESERRRKEFQGQIREIRTKGGKATGGELG